MHDCQLIHHRVSYVFKVISSQSRTQRYDKTNSCLSSTASSVPGRGVPHWSLEVWETTAMVVYIKIKAKEWPVFIEGSWQYYGLKPAGYVVTRIVAERERESRAATQPGTRRLVCGLSANVMTVPTAPTSKLSPYGTFVLHSALNHLGFSCSRCRTQAAAAYTHAHMQLALQAGHREASCSGTWQGACCRKLVNIHSSTWASHCNQKSGGQLDESVT